MPAAHILVVDDQPAITRLLRLMLGALGYRVTVATTGPAALDAFHRDEPDLVMLDLNLPDLPGWEVCRQLKAVSTVPILIMTGYVLTDLQAEHRAPEADAYLIKPFEMDAVVAHLTNLLHAAASRPAPTAP